MKFLFKTCHAEGVNQMENIIKFPTYRLENSNGEEITDTVMVTIDWTFSLSGIPMPVSSICKFQYETEIDIEKFINLIFEKIPPLRNACIKLVIDKDKKHIHISQDTQNNTETHITYTEHNNKHNESRESEQGIPDKSTLSQQSLFDESEIIVSPKNGSQVSLNLFGDEEKGIGDDGSIISDSCKSEKTAETRSQKTGSKSNLKSTSKALDLKIMDLEWNLAFAAQTFNLSEFFSVIPEGGLTLEQIRERLELDFPEFAKERTRWDLNKEKKLLFPISSGTSKA